MKLIALRPQSGVYGKKAPGESIDVDGTVAKQLSASPCWATPAEAKKHFAALAKKNADIKARSFKTISGAALADTASDDGSDDVNEED